MARFAGGRAAIQMSNSVQGRCRPAALTALLLSSAGYAGDFQLDASYTADVMAIVTGGIDTGARYLDLLVLKLGGDIAAPWEAGRGKFGLQGMYTNGSTISDELVGDLQAVSNIEARQALRLYQAWYQFGGEDWSIRAGLYDLNSEFDVNETGALFLHSSHGIGAEIGQTGENGPGIFPVSALTLRAAYEGKRINARFAVMDAVPGDPDDPSSNRVELRSDDGVLAVGEFEIPDAKGTRVWAGAWRYSAELEQPFVGGEPRKNDGWYIGAERPFSMRSRKAAWFLRYGEAEERINPFASYLGLGIVVEGPFPSRCADRFGIALASARTGRAYREYLAAQGATPAQRENAWEMTYRAQVSERWAIQPDVQFVQAPSANDLTDDAWLVGLRVEFAF